MDVQWTKLTLSHPPRLCCLSITQKQGQTEILTAGCQSATWLCLGLVNSLDLYCRAEVCQGVMIDSTVGRGYWLQCSDRKDTTHI